MNTTPNMSPTTVTVIGGSRGTGALVATRAQSLGRGVRIVSRSGGPGPQHVAADATDIDAVRSAIRGSDAVVVVVGAPGRDRSGVRAAVTAATVRAMNAEGVRRLVVQSSFGIADSADLLPFVTKRIIVPLFLRRAFDDHEAQEELVRASRLDWTIVRPAYLTDKPATGRPIDIASGQEGAMSPKVSRHDVARRIVELLDDSQSVHRTITLGTPR